MRTGARLASSLPHRTGCFLRPEERERKEVARYARPAPTLFSSSRTTPPFSSLSPSLSDPLAAETGGRTLHAPAGEEELRCRRRTNCVYCLASPLTYKKVYSHIELNCCYIRLIQTYCIFNGFHCWAKSSDGRYYTLQIHGTLWCYLLLIYRPCGCRSHGCAVHVYAGPNCPSSVYLSEVAGSCKAWPTATTLGAVVLCILHLGLRWRISFGSEAGFGHTAAQAEAYLSRCYCS
ncbi:uncharacterized protein LOC125524303 [Triticum urartu]|uniref:uncharacterized protein LOC125524303 n=1 Tax=Triticum urartu TaxID=4572 RepID=UPI002043D5C6|nr:uncharacterized protein LOC125524303 [Triticum urartu]